MSDREAQQLLPGFFLSSDADFAGFFTPPALRLVSATLQRCIREREPDCIFLAGPEGSGKSHLLQAACNAAAQQQLRALYLPLSQLCAYQPAEVLENADTVDIVCLDDLEAIAGNLPWQEAIFHLYNQRFQQEKPLYFAARVPARALSLELPDLASRLAACLAFQLPALDDEQKAALLIHLAQLRGMALNEVCARYIVQHMRRGIADLVAMLEKLDHASLVAGRKLTVPFIRAVLDEPSL